MPLERVPDALSQTAIAESTPTASPTDSKVLAIRKSAVLDTGRRKVAYRKRRDGAYELVELSLGPLAESRDKSGLVVNYYPVLAGVKAGDEVVVEGAFLLDSQRQIEGMPSLLYAEGQAATSLHAGHGGDEMPSSTPAPAAHKH
jgi:hypothetical protein